MELALLFGEGCAVIFGGGGSIGGGVEGGETFDGLIEFCWREIGLVVTFDPGEQVFKLEDVGRHVGLEGGAANEDDGRVEAMLWELEECFQGAEVKAVLTQWVLEALLAFVDLLRPLALVFGAENPPLVIFGFDDEDAVDGDDDVVDLCGALTVCSWEVEIVEAAIMCVVETMEDEANLTFPPPAFDGW